MLPAVEKKVKVQTSNWSIRSLHRPPPTYSCLVNDRYELCVCASIRVSVSMSVSPSINQGLLSFLQSSSWVATSMLVCLTIWNFILVVLYCKRKKRQRMAAKLAQYEECPNESSSDASSVSAEELGDVTASQKPANPFSKT